MRGFWFSVFSWEILEMMAKGQSLVFPLKSENLLE